MRMSKSGAKVASLQHAPVSLSPGGVVGQTGLEPVTPRLSSVCSNQLSYRPLWVQCFRTTVSRCFGYRNTGLRNTEAPANWWRLADSNR